jgi:hypothetical protein
MDDFTLFVGLEFLDRIFAFPAILSDGFVDATICTTADEANDVILVPDPYFAGIPSSGGSLGV